MCTQAVSEPRKERRWVNPYLRRVGEFADRIFTPTPGSAELAALLDGLKGSNRKIVELGSGSGQHLIELAKKNPDADCWGVERRYKRAVRTIEKAKRAEAVNAYVLRTEAERLAELFSASSVDGIYVNFPDPWLRPKQWKHRMLSAPMLDRAAYVLRDGGYFSAKTDSAEYFEWFREQAVSDQRFELVEESRDLANSRFAEKNIVTEFESMFLAQKLPIHYLRLVKRDASAQG